jgi:hypothetical protein
MHMSAVRNGSRCTVVLALAACAAGCMQARTEESREMPTKIAPGEAIVILAKPPVEGAPTEVAFMDCVCGSLSSGKDGMPVRNNIQFRDTLFPWFEPGTAPAKPEAVAAMLSHPGVSEKITTTGVRYVVWLNGKTVKTAGGGSGRLGVWVSAGGRRNPTTKQPSGI